MSVARTHSMALLGLDGVVVEIETDLSSGLPGFALIGLPDAALAQARERVRVAIGNSGADFPSQKLTVNLSPAALPKHGSGFDLAIGISVLAASGVIPPGAIERVLHLGELGLDGRLRPTPGILPAVVAARRAGFATVVVPAANAHEAALVPGIRVCSVASLREAAIHHGAELESEPVEPILGSEVREAVSPPVGDLADVVGSPDAVDAIVTAAAGGHHAFLLGPPGAGKTMLAARLPGILPDLEPDAALEVGSLRSLSGLPVGQELGVRPPFESPHHTATAAALVGGGSGRIRPGAAARASHGVLFLDEAPEFRPSVLDALRQPLESGVITIHRANAVATYPGRFQLLLAANPCPCGHFGSPDRECTCPPQQRRRYLSRISGPLLDRIDIQFRVGRISVVELTSPAGAALTSAEAAARVRQARSAARERWHGTGWTLNAEVPGSWLRQPAWRLPAPVTASLDRALERGAISMRGYDRVVRLSWTVADLAGASRPSVDHVAHALYLRRNLGS